MALEYYIDEPDDDPYAVEFRQGVVLLNDAPVDAYVDHDTRTCVVATRSRVSEDMRQIAGVLLETGISIGMDRQRRRLGMVPIVG